MTSSDQRYILHVHQGDSALPVLCPVLHPLGGHRLSNPTPRRELSSTEEEQHIFGESWLHWWSWMKPAACGMFKVARTGDAKLPPWTYMQDHILDKYDVTLPMEGTDGLSIRPGSSLGLAGGE